MHYEVRQISEISNDFQDLQRQGRDKINGQIRTKESQKSAIIVP